MEIRAPRGLRHRHVLPLREHLGKQIAEGRSLAVVDRPGEIEALELERNRRRSPRERARVVMQAALGIAQRLVGARDLLEPGFCRVVTRIDVRMVLAGKAPVRTLDLNQRRFASEAQQLV